MADPGCDPMRSAVQGRRLENLPTPPLALATPLPEGRSAPSILCFRQPGNPLCHQGTERASLQRVDPMK